MRVEGRAELKWEAVVLELGSRHEGCALRLPLSWPRPGSPLENRAKVSWRLLEAAIEAVTCSLPKHPHLDSSAHTQP